MVPEASPSLRLRRLVGTQVATFLAVLFCALPSSAYQWTYATVADGLPGNLVNELLHAPDGSVWVATASGIGRFSDGSWDVVDASTGCEALAVDGLDRIWAGCVDGTVRLFRPDGSSITTPSEFSNLPGGSIVDLSPMGGDSMWLVVAGDSGLGGLWRWQRVPVPGLAIVGRNLGGEIFSAVEGGTTAAWVGSNRGIRRWTGSTLDEVVPIDPDDPGNFRTNGVTTIVPLGNGSFTVGMQGGAAWWFDGAGAFVRILLPEPGGLPIEAGLLDEEGDVWLARESAFEITGVQDSGDPGDWGMVSVDQSDGIQGRPVYALLQRITSSTVETWFGTDAGISVRSRPNWEVFDTTNGLLGAAAPECANAECAWIRRIAFDATREGFWLGGERGLSLRDVRGDWFGWVTLGGSSPLLDELVRDVFVDVDGSVWVATGEATVAGPRFGGVRRLAANESLDAWETVGDAGVDPRWLVYEIQRDTSGDLWTASHDGVWRSADDGESQTRYTPSSGAPDAPVSSLALDEDRVVAASESSGSIGVYAFATDSWTRFRLQDVPGLGGVAPRVERVALRDDVLLVATSNGLVVAPVASSVLTDAVLLDGRQGFANRVRDVATGEDGTVLVSTDEGLFRTIELDPPSWRRFTLGDDGLPSVNLLCAIDIGGEVWIGTGDVGAMRHRFVPPQTVIDRAPPSVASDQDVVEVEVDATDPDSPEASTRFQWRFDDGVWSAPSNDRVITLVMGNLGLVEGPHVFEVRAVDTELLVDVTPEQRPLELDATPPLPVITNPRQGDAVRGRVSIRGTADDLRFDGYSARVWPASEPGNARELVVWSAESVGAGELATWDTSAGDTADDFYVVEVVVRDSLNVSGLARVEVQVDNEFPFAGETSPVQIQGERGGDVYSLRGAARLTVPPFAFDDSRTISIEETDIPGVHAFVIGPSSLRMRSAGRLRLRVEDSARRTIHRFHADAWTAIGGTEEVVDGVVHVSAAIREFGVYALRAEGVSSSSSGGILGFGVQPRHLRPRSGSSGEVTNIAFELARPADVRIVIYDRDGRPCREIADQRRFGAGQQLVEWDGRDRDGELVTVGLYIVAIEVDGDRRTEVVTVGYD